MSKLLQLTPILSVYIPKREDFKPGNLYISNDYMTASHLCPCGCNELVVTPLKRINLQHRKRAASFGWDATEEIDENQRYLFSLEPSIGSFNLPCRSHYFIRKNQLQWCEEPIKN